MPFLRAALIKKKAPELETDEEIIVQPVAPAPVIPDTFENVPDEAAVEVENDVVPEKREYQESEEPQEFEQQEEFNEPDNGSETGENSLPEEVPEIPAPQEFEPEFEPKPEGEVLIQETQVEIEENIVESEPEPEVDTVQGQTEEPETEGLTEIGEVEEVSTVSEPEPEPEQLQEDRPPEINPEDIPMQYDFDSNERYVDKVSTKTEFDKMLDELAAISKDLLSWEVEKFAKKFTGKYKGEDGKKYEAFLGGYITNAAMTLYDNGYKDEAIKQLEQAKSVLTARQKLEDETQAIKDRVEEEGAAVDLSDILGMFGDG